ncbi:pili assembly chaperone, partial [Salmonella enterica subsp. enterica serovar Kentucky]|nr:pili assembly chaperone [Salmonella enterica subsp. enterica serovar Kentucky]ECA8297065.1 pili assembly chaperone [Salmonella enterica subsp. enterica serovar Kentucky]ECS9574331.1 pili assembly chaperone [Salmonella enterica subsp. enterica serovar Kentucky]EDH4339911.1 pili assembly chaperone [Salmonella enterica subsp. enterica serovar Kentucky]EDJ2749384.1 pili assembly chaperone [Salmonella enterica subsp. enterica serovar Kentucky]
MNSNLHGVIMELSLNIGLSEK